MRYMIVYSFLPRKKHQFEIHENCMHVNIHITALSVYIHISFLPLFTSTIAHPSTSEATMTQLITFLAILFLISGSARSQMLEPSCSMVVIEVEPCLSFLKGGDRPSQACCKGVKDMGNAARTKADKTVICECIKNALSGVTYDPARIPLLSKKCGVSISLPPIDDETDCSKAFGDCID